MSKISNLTSGAPAQAIDEFIIRRAGINLSLTPDDLKNYINAQPADATLTQLANLSTDDGNFIVADGTNWTVESGGAAAASLGLSIGVNVQAWNASLDTISGITPLGGVFIVGNGSSFEAQNATTVRSTLSLVVGSDVQAFNANTSITDISETRTANIELSTTTHSTTISAAAGANYDLDVSLSNRWELTLDENITLTISNPPSNDKYQEIEIIFIQDATGTNTVTWPAEVFWPGGINPVITSSPNAIDVIKLRTNDSGTSWLGEIIGQNYS